MPKSARDVGKNLKFDFPGNDEFIDWYVTRYINDEIQAADIVEFEKLLKDALKARSSGR